MPYIIKLLTGLLFSYFLGSIPTAYIFGKLTKGVDLRKCGSGNLGATNAFRVLGKRIGTSVLLLDILKGTTAVILCLKLFFVNNPHVSKELFICLSAIAAISGHNWTIFLGFKGGKGIATSLGALIAFSILIPNLYIIVLGVIFLWLLIFLTSGYVSLASVIASIALPVFSAFLNLPIEILCFLAIIAIFSLIRHKSNIIRLLQKKEHRFNTTALLSKFLGKTLSK